MDWIDELIKLEKARERERRKRNIKKKIKTSQSKSYIHKEHRKQLKKKIFSRVLYYEIPVFPNCHSKWFSRLRKVEQKLQEQLLENLISAGYVVHQEVSIPHHVWPIRLDVHAEKGDNSWGFEVKSKLDIRGLGQVSWYSNYIHKIIPEMNIFLAFSCHQFQKLKYPEVKSFINRLRDNFGLGLCGIRDPRGDAPGGLRLYTEEIKWYDICFDCIYNNGFYYSDYATGRHYIISKDDIENFYEELNKRYEEEIKKRFSDLI